MAMSILPSLLKSPITMFPPRAAGGGNNGGRAVDAFAFIEQHAQAAVRVRDHDVELAVPVEVGQRNGVGLHRDSSRIVHWRFEFSISAADQHGNHVVRTPGSAVGHGGHHIGLAVPADVAHGDIADPIAIGLAATDRCGNRTPEHAVGTAEHHRNANACAAACFHDVQVAVVVQVRRCDAGDEAAPRVAVARLLRNVPSPFPRPIVIHSPTVLLVHNEVQFLVAVKVRDNEIIRIPIGGE